MSQTGQTIEAVRSKASVPKFGEGLVEKERREVKELGAAAKSRSWPCFPDWYTSGELDFWSRS